MREPLGSRAPVAPMLLPSHCTAWYKFYEGLDSRPLPSPSSSLLSLCVSYRYLISLERRQESEKPIESTPRQLSANALDAEFFAITRGVTDIHFTTRQQAALSTIILLPLNLPINESLISRAVTLESIERSSEVRSTLASYSSTYKILLVGHQPLRRIHFLLFHIPRIRGPTPSTPFAIF